MKSQRIRLSAILTVISLTVGTAVFAAGGSDSGTPPDNLPSVALVATQKAGDEGPIDGLIDGLEMATEQFGLESRFIEALDPAALETTLRNLARSGTDIIISTFYEMGAASAAVAPEFPETRFIVIVANPINPVMPNVRTLDYGFYQGAYVGGIYAAHLSETGRLGYTGGVPLPFAWADFNAFTAGARSINPNIQTTAAFIESFEDPVKGRELAANLYSQDIDFIFTGAAASDIGVVEAAASVDGLVMVASKPLINRAPENVAILVSIEWEKTIVREIEYALSDDFEGGFRRADVTTGEIDFTIPLEFLNAASPDRVSRAETAGKAVDSVVAGIKDGSIVIEEVGEEL